jgi:NAD(P)-dependent dehydrogenase (short-subunit alcohol dehydrogenase family)
MATLEGKLALVTGGGRGLGAAICRELARAGATLVVADRDLDGAGRVAAEIGKSGGRARVLGLDVGDAAAAEGALRGLERIDVLVNNAAIDHTLPIDELSVGQWDAVMQVNLRGPFVMSKLAAARMKAQGGGQIVNIASTAAKRAWPNASVYHASKWGLLGLSYALHAELRPHGIKVSAVVAGGMRTPFLLDRFPDIDPGVLQDPANVAATVRFLLTLPAESVIPEIMVIPMRETSWP